MKIWVYEIGTAVSVGFAAQSIEDLADWLLLFATHVITGLSNCGHCSNHQPTV